jgi:hypothetical protein
MLVFQFLEGRLLCRAVLERKYRRIEIRIDVDPLFLKFLTRSLKLLAHARIQTGAFTSNLASLRNVSPCLVRSV